MREHKGLCQASDAYTFQVTFTEDSDLVEMQGETFGAPFLNPYSAVTIGVSISYLSQCDSQQVLYESNKSGVTFDFNHISQGDNLVLESSTNKVGEENVLLQVRFKPRYVLKAQGKLSLTVPNWYMIGSQPSSLQMIETKTQVSITNKGYTVLSQNFDSSSRTMVIDYQGEQDMQPGEDQPLQVTYTNFRNPIDTSPKSGFQFTTMDSDGHLMEQSTLNTTLSNQMTQLANFTVQFVEAVGNEDGQFIATINEFNIVDITLTSSVPLELDCLVDIYFPEELKLEAQLNQIYGYGFFQPQQQTDIYPQNMYTIDYSLNRISVQACSQADQLSRSPTGQISFSMIMLPNVVKSTSEFNIEIYSDDYRHYGSVQQSTPLVLPEDGLNPGSIDMISFEPDDYNAMALDVMYVVSFAPKHDLLVNSRIIVEFPELLTIEPDSSHCQVLNVQPGVTCTIKENTNMLYVENYFQDTNQGGKLLQLHIGPADNPTAARLAGTWSVRTETEVDGEYYKVDEASSNYSFWAQPSLMDTFWSSISLTTFQIDVRYTFDLYPLYDIPPNGYITVYFPDDFQVTVSSAMQSEGDHWKAYSANITTFTAQLDGQGHNITNNPLEIDVYGVRNPRSFRPAGVFNITTQDDEGYMVCQGGNDLTVAMNQMRLVDDFEVIPMNLTNGAITNYKFIFQTAVTIKDGDVFKLTFPEEIEVIQSENDNTIVCDPGTQIVDITCTMIGQHMNVVLNKITGYRGRYDFIVEGVKNPPSNRPTKSFSEIHIETYDYWDMIEFSDQYDKTVSYSVKMEYIDYITEYKLQQETYSYSTPTQWTITFTPKNRIGKDGAILIEYPETTMMNNDTTCVIKTYKSFNSTACQFLEDQKRVIINGTFEGKQANLEEVTIILENVINLPNNYEIYTKLVNITTYDDKYLFYPIDTFTVNPYMECIYPCKYCNLPEDRSDCNACWDFGPYQYLMANFTSGINMCTTGCDSGYSTNGTVSKTCTQCDVSCVTCLDDGNPQDASRCTECADGYPYIGESNQFCYQKCPFGTYGKANMLCGDCDSNCGDCSGSPTHCTACDQDSDYPFLLDNKCVAQCPDEMLQISGECLPCEFPCNTCANSTSMCTSCLQDSGQPFNFAFQCFSECPVMTSTNEELSICEGCLTGCDACDQYNQTLCYECTAPFLLFETQCITECPTDYRPNYKLTYCRHKDTFLMRVIYFPFLICSVILVFISIISHKRKRKHKVISNLIIMMGPLEHLAMITQFVLCFVFADYIYAAAIGFILILYTTGNLIFYFRMKKKISNGNDVKHEFWKEKHPTAKKFIPILSFMSSWKFYKLLYSHFIGIKIKPSTFDTPWVYVKLQKQQMIFTIVVVYLPLFIVDLIGMASLQWDQYFITQIETAILCIVLSILMIWEQRKIWYYMSQDEFKLVKEEQTMSAIATLGDMTVADLNIDKSRVISQYRNKMFAQRKIEDIKEQFKKQKCLSDIGDTEGSNRGVDDSREVKSNPVSPDRHERYQYAARPVPRPETPSHPNNVYVNPRNVKNLKKMSRDAPKKLVQVGADDEQLRSNTQMVEFPPQPSQDRENICRDELMASKKKGRGRPGRFYKQIENEDVKNYISTEEEIEQEQKNIFDPNQLENENSQEESAEIKARKQMHKEIQEKRLEDLKAKKAQQEQADDRQMRDLQAAFSQRRKEEIAAVKRQKEEAQQLKDKIARDEKLRQEELELAIQKEKKAILDKKQKEAQRQKEEAASMARKKAEQAVKQQEERQAKAKAIIEESIDDYDQQAVQLLTDISNGAIQESDQQDQNLRTFNVHDIIADKYKEEVDIINQCGYLIDPVTHDILHNQTRQVVFTGDKLSNKGEIPYPYRLEKYNFNPFEMQGSLIIEQDIRTFLKKYTKSGDLVDQQGKTINMQGFLIDSKHSLIDIHGNVKFNKNLLGPDNRLPYLLNYTGESFEILDVMGIFDRNKQNNELQLTKNDLGQLIDKTGHLVNQKGYLINKQGDIVSRQTQDVLFTKAQLKNNDFPKLFQFTKINLNRIKANKKYISSSDEKGRLVNSKGYFTDNRGNILDYKGDIVLDRSCLVDGHQEVPPVFHMHDLIANSSDISNLSDRLSSDSTVQSAMQESPSKNIINLSKSGAAFSSQHPDEENAYQITYDPAKSPKRKRAKTNSRGRPKLKKQLAQSQMASQSSPKQKLSQQAYEYGLGLNRAKTGKRQYAQKPSQKDKTRLSNTDRGIISTDGFASGNLQDRNQHTAYQNMMATQNSSQAQLRESKLSGDAESLMAREFPTQAAVMRQKRLTENQNSETNITTNASQFMKQSQSQIKINQGLKGVQSRKSVGNTNTKKKTLSAVDKEKLVQEEFERIYKKEIEQFLQDSDWDAQSQHSFDAQDLQSNPYQQNNSFNQTSFKKKKKTRASTSKGRPDQEGARAKLAQSAFIGSLEK